MSYVCQDQPWVVLTRMLEVYEAQMTLSRIRHQVQMYMATQLMQQDAPLAMQDVNRNEAPVIDYHNRAQQVAACGDTR